MVGILLYTPNILLSGSIIINPAARFSSKMKQQNRPYMHPNDQDLVRKWANDHGKCVRQRTVRQETSNFKTGTLPVNMCETAVHGGERLDFAQNEGSEVPQDDEKKDGSSSGI